MLSMKQHLEKDQLLLTSLKDEMKKFQIIIVNFINVWIGFTIVFLSFVFSLEGPVPQGAYFWMIITLLMLIPVLSSYTITALIIDRDRHVVVVEWRRWFFISKTEEYPIANVRAELSNEMNKLGRKHDVFKIYADNVLLKEMVTWFTGWHKEIVLEFIHELKS